MTGYHGRKLRAGHDGETIRGEWRRGGRAFFTIELQGLTWETTVEADGMLSVALASALLDVTTVTIYRWIADGLLKSSNDSAPSSRKQRRQLIRLSQLRKVAEGRGFRVTGVGG